jgi:hypothetical protein
MQDMHELGNADVHLLTMHRRIPTHRTRISEMTGSQSKTLKVGDRVCWNASTKDLGTIVGTTWDGVSIDWDDGKSTSIQHNDMGQVERAQMKAK